MPTPFSELDTNFPFFRKNEGAEEKINELQDYMFLLLENLRWTLNHLDERNITEEGKKRITEPITIDIRDAVNGLQTEIDILPGQIMTLVSAGYESKTEAAQAAAQILQTAETYADGVGSTISAQVAATYQPISGMSAYQTITAAASQLAEAKTYADGAVSSLSQSVASTYQTISGMSSYETTAAAAQSAAATLASANAYADGAVSTLSQSVAANYLANSARAGIVADATAAATGAVAQMVLYVEDGNGTSSISINGGTIELNTNITEVNGTLHIGGDDYRGNGTINLNRWSSITADSNEDMEVYAGSTLMLDAYSEVWIEPGDGSMRIYAGSAGRYWYFDGTGIYWCNSNGSVRKSVVLE